MFINRPPHSVRHRPASTMLMALLIMSTILAVSLSVGQVIFLEISLIKTSNETVVATYAAESALEQGAYRVRSYSDTLPALSGSKALSNNASWTRVASGTVGSLVLRPLRRGQTRGFDFYNPETAGAGGEESVKIVVDTCDSDGSDWIELGFQSFDPATLTLGTFQKIRYNCTGNNWTQTNNTPTAGQAYRLYVRYVQGTSAALSRVTVTGCTLDNGGGVCSLPGQVDITATGNFRTAARTMDLIMPRLSPVTGIFDYGVFSECQISKDPSVGVPSC